MYHVDFRQDGADSRQAGVTERELVAPWSVKGTSGIRPENAAGGAASRAVLRPLGCDSVASRLSLPHSRLRALAVRNTPCSLATSAAAAHKGCGIGSRPVCTSAIVQSVRESHACCPEHQPPLCPSPVLLAPARPQDLRYQLRPRHVTHGHRKLTKRVALEPALYAGHSEVERIPPG